MHTLKNITHLIFDWDGTIMDSSAKIISCMQQAAQECDLKKPSADAVKHIIGISLLPAIQKLFDIEKNTALQVQEHYKRIFVEQDQTKCDLFTGAHQVLSRLSSHYVLGVATGKARRGLNRAFDQTSTKQYFTHSICADEAESKPSSDMLLKLLHKWDIPVSQALMIGDTIYDMKMAENIGMARIGVSYGVHEKSDLLAHTPLAIVDNLPELANLFLTER